MGLGPDLKDIGPAIFAALVMVFGAVCLVGSLLKLVGLL